MTGRSNQWMETGNSDEGRSRIQEAFESLDFCNFVAFSNQSSISGLALDIACCVVPRYDGSAMLGLLSIDGSSMPTTMHERIGASGVAAGLTSQMDA